MGQRAEVQEDKQIQGLQRITTKYPFLEPAHPARCQMPLRPIPEGLQGMTVEEHPSLSAVTHSRLLRLSCAYKSGGLVKIQILIQRVSGGA